MADTTESHLAGGLGNAQSGMTDGELHAIREMYRPTNGVRFLLLGESPPPGRGFFYTGDSSLYRFTAPVLEEECGFPTERERFLLRFARAGFFLDDFSSIRGDKPAERPNDHDVRAAVKRIAATISRDGPVVVVGVLLSIRDLVRDAVAASSNSETPWECLHFPHPRNQEGQRRYKDGLRRIVHEFGCEFGHDP